MGNSESVGRPFIPTTISTGTGGRRPFIPNIISTGGGGITLDLLTNFEQDDLRLCMPRNDDVLRVYNPTPLRCYRPPTIQEAADQSSSSLLPDNAGGNKKRKRSHDAARKRRPKRGDDDNAAILLLPPPPPPPPSIEEFPLLIEAIHSRNATRPVFLYRKKLELSDVKKDQNRLMLTGREAVMQFLRPDEAAAVEQGFKICGLDEHGKIYTLVLKRWASMMQIVINSGWNKLVAANNAAAGDVVELWGFREANGKPGFAVVFRRA